MNESFAKFARAVAVQCGHAYAFVLAVVLILVWVMAGFYYGFDDQLYELVINTITTIVTFLMVFLLQHSQNRDTLAMQIKLDELISASEKASNRMQQIENKTETELISIRDSKNGGEDSVHCEVVQVEAQQEVVADQSEEGSEDSQRDAETRSKRRTGYRNRKRQS
jgi:low affinity Fe/Cu permease